ncbi:MAG: hypothetical protein J6R80_04090 [Kiritimatiellae bacterium]|jgi:hypothetical protein|nr:hypothetical protein [Kiritimatiellia bacterium]
MSQEWNLRSRGHVCTLCQKPLTDKTPVVSALKEVSGGYERFDCHPECWKALARDWTPFSQWDGVYFAPVKEAKKEPLKKEDAGELLRQLVTLDDPAMKNVIYVLAVMLERAKILVERDSKTLEDGSIRRVYEDRKQGDTFVILDPRLRLENLSEVQQQVVALLSGTKTFGEVASDSESESAGAEPTAEAE